MLITEFVALFWCHLSYQLCLDGYFQLVSASHPQIFDLKQTVLFNLLPISQLAPENTQVSFETALMHNVSGMETDVSIRYVCDKTF